MTKSDNRIRVSIDAELEEIVPRYIQLRHEDREAIRSALDEGDYETISRLSHSMKGSGVSYGFDRISEIGQAMECAAKSAEKEEVDKYLLELSTYLKNVEVTFK